MVGGMTGVGGVSEMCLCLICGGVRGDGFELIRGVGFFFTNHVETRGLVNVCLCLGYGGVCGVGGELVGVREGWLVLCLCEL